MALQYQPQEALDCMDMAMHEVLLQRNKIQDYENKVVKCRLHKYNLQSQKTPIGKLVTFHIGKLVTVNGTVIRTSNVRQQLHSCEFECSTCSENQKKTFEDGVFTYPQDCPNISCKSTKFTYQQKSVSTKDWQTIRIQDIQNGYQSDGRVPKTIEVDLYLDLVDICLPGDMVQILGILKVTTTNDNKYFKGKNNSLQNNLYRMSIKAVSVVNTKNQPGVQQRSALRTQVAQSLQKEQIPQATQPLQLKDLQFIIKLSEQYAGQQFEFLTHSLCPNIFHHEMIKAGILLSLIGGVQKFPGASKGVPVRGNIHVLIIGDPGLGKSRLLQATSKAAPYGLYVSSNTSTTAGLTLSVIKDSQTGDYSFEAGALVLADRGVCCLDEFDKIPSDYQALLQAMEQQQVSIAKAGMVTTIPARTTIVAAANPQGGKFVPSKTILENLRMHPALLSRFDLVFVMKDLHDVQADQYLSEHVVALHAGKEDRAQKAQQSLMKLHKDNSHIQDTQNTVQDTTVLYRLRNYQDTSNLLPHQLLRKYIDYARQYVNPVLSDDAKIVLQEYYLHIRANQSPNTQLPITARQLESLIRMAEARARVELREQVTKQDAIDVVEIMQYCLNEQIISAGYGASHQRSKGGRSGKIKETERFLDVLRKISKQQSKSVFEQSELFRVADEIELQVPDTHRFIEELNDLGFILLSGPRQYKLL